MVLSLLQMSECSIIGSYTVQFMEMRGFSLCLQASFATHLLQLVKDMKVRSEWKMLYGTLSYTMLESQSCFWIYCRSCVIFSLLTVVNRKHIIVWKSLIEDPPTLPLCCFTSESPDENGQLPSACLSRWSSDR